MKRSITILGCGSSGGVPRVAGGWGACDPAEPRNRRRRCSILIRQTADSGTTQVLVDTSPDMREQLIAAEVMHLDGIVFTHEHADHTHGIDDVRPLVIHNRKRIDAFIDDATAPTLVDRFNYVFRSPEGSSYPPILTHRPITAGQPFAVNGAGGPVPIRPLLLRHGEVDALGIKLGRAAYTPDVSDIPEAALEELRDLDIWIIDALRIHPHPSHFHLDLALEWIARLKPKRAVLTNLHNDLDYETLSRDLPDHIRPAHDGLEIEVAAIDVPASNVLASDLLASDLPG